MSKMWDIFFKAQQNKILGEGQEKKKSLHKLTPNFPKSLVANQVAALNIGL